MFLEDLVSLPEDCEQNSVHLCRRSISYTVVSSSIPNKNIFLSSPNENAQLSSEGSSVSVSREDSDKILIFFS